MNAFDSAGDAEIILYGALDLPPVVPATDVGHLEEKAVLPHLQQVVYEPLVLVGKGGRIGVRLAAEPRPLALTHHATAAGSTDAVTVRTGPSVQDGDGGRVAHVEADGGCASLARQIPRLAPERLVVEEFGRRDGDGRDGVVHGDGAAARIRHVGHARVVPGPVYEAAIGTLPTNLECGGR